MSFYDRAVKRAIAEGKSANDFYAGAQKKANAIWFWLIVSGAVWYFFGWGWALISSAISIVKIIGFIDATIVASRIEKLSDKHRV